MAENYDYIIVGAGSAGCVLAARLSEQEDVSVLLLEAGGSDKSIFVQMPTALSIPMNTKRFNWGFESEPESFLGNRVLHCPRGKGLGGSSSINGMVYVRGCAGDFDEWEAAGAKGWSYRNCLPYFAKAETWHKPDESNQQATYRGEVGPLSVNNGNNRKFNPLYDAFIQAGVEAGYGATKDYNAYRQEGFGPMHMTVKDGVRWSTANAYLRPAMKRQNLSIKKHVLVDRILMDGRSAKGLVYRNKSGQERRVFANKEVVLTAGSIGSPTILQRSGIGPADVLTKAGVAVKLERKGVGANLKDHLEVYFQFRCKQPITLNSRLGLLSKGWIGARWLLTKTGLGATNHFEACAFIRSKAGVKWPDIQYHFLPAAMRYDGKASFDGHGFQVHVGPNKPHSTGSVAIKNQDPKAHPEIRFNYLEDPRDVEDWRRAIRLTREIIGQPALADYKGPEIQPGEGVDTDEEIDAWVREHVESAYHASCTCRMGDPNDPMTVVDPECRVVGIENLRVVDSSIFPTIPNGNLNAPSIMVGERGAGIILGRQPLAASNAPSWFDPNWETQQREFPNKP